MWDLGKYKIWLKNRLVEIKNTLDFNDFSIEVYSEQDYTKQNAIKPKTISVVIKFLQANIIYGAKSQPIQMLIISEENSLSVANSIVTKFTEDYNFSVLTDDSAYIKHSYSSPSVLSNFNLIGVGYRTILYVGATLFILDNVVDLSNLAIDGETIDYISATIGYTMSGDTQAFNSGFAHTIKSFATLIITLTVVPISNNFINKCIAISSGQTNNSGNETFVFTFSIGGINFNLSLKMVGLTYGTAINNVPSLQLSFSV